MGQNTSQPKIEGFCDPKFEKVKKHFKEMLINGADENLQLCVFVEDKCVIDLCGSSNDKYNAESLQTVFSSGKSIEAIVMAILYDRGLFKYDDKVIEHWPEFGQHGKEDIKICDILRHESGMADFSSPLDSCEDAWSVNIKQNKIGKLIEQETPRFPPEKNGVKLKREYHALTRGCLVNELVRRLHPEVTLRFHLKSTSF